MKKILSWIFTPLHALIFIIIILVFHVSQVIALNLFGYQAHKKVVDGMIACMLTNLRLVMWVTIRFGKIPDEITTDKPLIIVSNHQSMFDIPMIGWLFRKNHPKYISKRELTKGIPSISYNIRNGGSIAINRSNAAEAVQIITEFGSYLEKHCYAGCIFPEGTRSRNGALKPFKTTGLVQLLKSAPNANVIPVAVQGSWKINLLPIPYGFQIYVTPLSVIKREQHTDEQVAVACEQSIRQYLESTH